jgi:DHA1 family inner membrane transport protein
LLWGATHTSGMLITQVWLTSVASEAPEFATSLFVSAGNGGVVLGSAVGGLFIDSFGTAGVIGCGLIFSALSALIIGAKALIYRAEQPPFQVISANQ